MVNSSDRSVRKSQAARQEEANMTIAVELLDAAS